MLQKQVAIIINHITSVITTAVVDRNKTMRMTETMIMIMGLGLMVFDLIVTTVVVELQPNNKDGKDNAPHVYTYNGSTCPRIEH